MIQDYRRMIEDKGYNQQILRHRKIRKENLGELL